MKTTSWQRLATIFLIETGSQIRAIYSSENILQIYYLWNLFGRLERMFCVFDLVFERFRSVAFKRAATRPKQTSINKVTIVQRFLEIC